jgi:hypothetical protein
MSIKSNETELTVGSVYWTGEGSAYYHYKIIAHTPQGTVACRKRLFSSNPHNYYVMFLPANAWTYFSLVSQGEIKKIKKTGFVRFYKRNAFGTERQFVNGYVVGCTLYETEEEAKTIRGTQKTDFTVGKVEYEIEEVIPYVF